MKKFTKFITLICMCVFTTGIMLTGCGKKIAPPDKSAEAYFNYVLTGDTAKFKEYGIPSTELEKTFKTDMDDIKSSLTSDFKSADMDITDDEINKIINSLIGTFKKLNPKIEASDIKDDTATVKITSNYIDIQQMVQKAATETYTEVKALNLTDQKELLNKFKESYIANIDKFANEAEPSSETKEFTYTFKKKEATEDGKTVTVWAPEDEVEFSNDVVSLLR